MPASHHSTVTGWMLN